MSKYESLVGLVSANVESLDVERYDFFGFESWKIWRFITFDNHAKRLFKSKF